jgi:hypothetical protein
VDWFTGEDAVGDAPLPAIARDSIADYLDGGGRLLVSGAELGWTLDDQGLEDERAFFHERLHARLLLDDAETYDVSAAADGPLSQLAPLTFADPTAYDPRFPDAFEPELGGTVAMLYDDGMDSAAAVAWGGGDAGERGVLLGFPFETIAGADVRLEVMAAILAFFEVEEPDPEDPGGTSTGPDPDDPGSSGESTAGPEGSDTTPGDTDTDGASAALDAGGCGCRSTPAAPFWLWLLPLVSRLRRRESTP